MKRVVHSVLAVAVVTLLGSGLARHAESCGAYGPPPMSQTMLAALSDDTRVAAAAVETMRQRGTQSMNDVKAQQFWLPIQIRRLDYQIMSFEKLVTADSKTLPDADRARHKLRLTQLRLERAEAKLRIKQLELLMKRLQWAIARSTVMA